MVATRRMVVTLCDISNLSAVTLWTPVSLLICFERALTEDWPSAPTRLQGCQVPGRPIMRSRDAFTSTLPKGWLHSCTRRQAIQCEDRDGQTGNCLFVQQAQRIANPACDSALIVPRAPDYSPLPERTSCLCSIASPDLSPQVNRCNQQRAVEA